MRGIPAVPKTLMCSFGRENVLRNPSFASRLEKGSTNIRSRFSCSYLFPYSTFLHQRIFHDRQPDRVPGPGSRESWVPQPLRPSGPGSLRPRVPQVLGPSGPASLRPCVPQAPGPSARPEAARRSSCVSGVEGFGVRGGVGPQALEDSVLMVDLKRLSSSLMARMRGTAGSDTRRPVSGSRASVLPCTPGGGGGGV